MSAPEVIRERLQKAKITRAAVIDDVFDGPALTDFGPGVGEFWEHVEDDEMH